MDFESNMDFLMNRSDEEVTIEMSCKNVPCSPGRTNPRSWRILVTEAYITIFDLRSVSSEINVEVPMLSIDRTSGCASESCSLLGNLTDTVTDEARELHAFAILGLLRAPTVCAAASGLLVVTKADLVCDIEGKRIWEVTDVERISVAGGKLSDGSSGAANHLCEGTLRLLCERGFYFSHDFDITHTLQWQKQHVTEANGIGEDTVLRLPDSEIDLMASAELRFVWNRRLTEELMQQGVSARWFVPLMQGHVQMAQCSEPHPDVEGWIVRCKVLLISRRGSGRAGTRYNARGLDGAGEVGNLIETEQLVNFQLEKAMHAGPLALPNDVPQGWLSFVQLRGSVPLFWDQSPQGPLQISHDGALAAPAFFRHHRSLEDAYGGHIFYLNLLSESSSAEQQLTDAMEQQLQSAGFHRGTYDTEGTPPKLYCHFDFHARVHGASQADFDSELEALVDQINSFLEWSGYLDGTADAVESAVPPALAQRRRWQNGVLRTNCLDCLDRTNVVQFFVAWSWLQTFCKKHRSLRSLVDASSPTAAVAAASHYDSGLSAAWQQAGNSLLEGAAAWQKAGASLLDSFFGSSVVTSADGGADGESVSADTGVQCDVDSVDDGVKCNGVVREMSRAPGSPPILRQLLQEIWADQGDRASQQYTGAASSMTSMLRQGRSTSYSVLERSWQGINRAYQASFQDSLRQECIDLLLGHNSAPEQACAKPCSSEHQP